MRDYELIDSGDQQKLERLGEYRIIRPEPLAVWKKQLSIETWRENLAAEYRAPRAKIGAGDWIFYNQQIAENPPILSWKPENSSAADLLSPSSLRFQVKFMPSRHLGLFPEHESQWQFIFDQVYPLTQSGQDFHLLNLFGFTGAASLAAALAGAHVTHIDSSYEAISLGRHNQELSALTSAPIRWIKEDVSKFVERELKRRPSFYDGIILDPPAHGHGTKKRETWHLTSMLPDLIEKLSRLFSPQAQFLILNTYTDINFPASIFAPLKSHFPYQQSGQLFLNNASHHTLKLSLSQYKTFTRYEI